MEDRVESSSPRHAVPDRQEDVLERNRAETFNERLRRRWQEARTLLCVGLDGEIERMPEQFRRGLAPGETNGTADEHERRIESALTEYHIAIVEATADLVCAYKPNIAFYEQHGPAGLRALIAVIAYIQKKYPEIPVLLDAKRGDIGSTSQAYARALFDVYGADAVTAQPYLGYDALEPFLGRADRGVFILCRTSNPGASELQDLSVRADESESETLYLRVARRVANEWNANGNCGLVVGATYPEELRQVRRDRGRSADPRAGRGRAGRRPGGDGARRNRQRRPGPAHQRLARHSLCLDGRRLRQRGAATGGLAAHGDRAAAWRPRKQRRLPQERRGSSERSRTGRIPMSDLTETQRAFADALLATGAVKFGAFRLKLHEKQPDAPLSPIYVDLRTLRSFPDALDDAVLTLVEMIAARRASLSISTPTCHRPRPRSSPSSRTSPASA